MYTLVFSKRNSSIIKNLEESFLHNNYGTSVNKIKRFHKLMEENLFEYHFQPIIHARTGDIYAYEALMRTNTEVIGMQPVEILDLAAKENRLYDIEKYTFYNTLKIMKDNSNTFQTRKLFINSVSSHQLFDEDFNLLYQKYGSLFKDIVIEITEATLLNDDGIKLLHKRLQKTNFQLALDDYGAGYSNASILLTSNPNFVKIDHSLIHNINVDSKKQHLVSNLVNFANHNQIKIIAEGIESYEELEYVISIGVDYIQGFYTAKPNPIIIDTISEDLLAKIRELNYKHFCDTSELMIV
jgi:EAL domain-containing protein (putative c-di-GMP-specific phosphodiesterase class I)